MLITPDGLGCFRATCNLWGSMSATFSYMGTKRQIADEVAGVISSTRRGPLLDLFAGISAVGSSVGPERQVWCNDVQHFAHTLATSIFTSREGPRLTPATIERVQYYADKNRRKVSDGVKELMDKEARYLSQRSADKSSALADNLVKASVSPNNYRLRRLHRTSCASRPYRLFTCTYAGGYLGLKQAVDLDSVRYAIDLMLTNREIEIEQHRWLLLGLCRSLTKVAHTTGHFAQYLAIKENTYRRFVARRRRDVFVEWVNAIRDMSPEGSAVWRRRNRTFRMDALELLHALPIRKGQPAVVYADPPYTRDHYSRYYHLLETLVLYDYRTRLGRGNIDLTGFCPSFR
jgi:adenine-specific DNA-methyltransferase